MRLISLTEKVIYLVLLLLVLTVFILTAISPAAFMDSNVVYQGF
jgi:hypothetical protein